MIIILARVMFLLVHVVANEIRSTRSRGMAVAPIGMRSIRSGDISSHEAVVIDASGKSVSHGVDPMPTEMRSARSSGSSSQIAVSIDTIGQEALQGMTSAPVTMRSASSSGVSSMRSGRSSGVSSMAMEAKFAATAKAQEETRVRGLAAQGRQMPALQANGELRVMYGVVTNSKPKYRRKLEAVLGTWASKPMAQGLFLAVGGKVYPPEWQIPDSVTAADCRDGSNGNSCKEATLVVEAAKRNATWLFIVGEDNYVDTEMVESALRAEASDVPVGLGCIGCGMHIEQYGELVSKSGGFCGGCGEALNRAALQRLTAEGGAALVQEYGDETQCDMSTSKAVRKRGIDLQVFPGRLSGNPVHQQEELERMVGTSATFHYVTPQVMPWIHAKRTGANEQEVHTLEAEAFEHGCARGMADNPFFRAEAESCIRQALGASR